MGVVKIFNNCKCKQLELLNCIFNLKMKSRPSSKFRLIVFLSITLSLWCDKITLANSEPKDLEQIELDKAQSNSQFPNFLVVDKKNGKKSLIKIEKQTAESLDEINPVAPVNASSLLSKTATARPCCRCGHRCLANCRHPCSTCCRKLLDQCFVLFNV